LAAGRTEMKGFAAVVVPMLACMWVDSHPADGIAQVHLTVSVMFMMNVIGMTGISSAAPGVRGSRLRGAAAAF
jgi:hypothetical protein